MAKYHLTNQAVQDLSDIWNYTFDNWSEEQADKCAFLEREVKDKYGADKSFFKQHHVDKVK